MSAPRVQCPPNSMLYNETLCACTPGYVFNAASNSCSFFNVSRSEWVINSGVDFSVTFPETIFSFDQLKKYTQSQTVFLEATVVVLASWLLFCGLARLGHLGDGRTPWFQIRWWISRLDVCFSTKHWLEDQKAVKKRKTELGGTFSIASWILFIGLFAALLYQIIWKRTLEVHNIRPANTPDLVTFVNDLEFNITAISTMSCSQLRGLGTLVLGYPGSIDYRMTRLSYFANYSCLNTSLGPTISLRCKDCTFTRDSAYISWQFIDIPNEPAIAVGFQFNLTARNRAQNRHVSVVSGTVKNGTCLDDGVPVTFRGVETNILKFNLFPRIYRNLHNLKLVQPLFHEFLPGSFISDVKELQESLQGSSNGFINTTVFINFLSSYIVEIDHQNIFGPVSFLANLGGLYCFSIGIFFFFLVQCERRIKKLQNEDQVLLDVKRRCRAQDHWNKLRKFVMYTWCRHSLLEDESINSDVCCTCVMMDPYKKNESLQKRSLRDNSFRTIGFQKNFSRKKMVKKCVSEPPKSVSSFVEVASPCLSLLNKDVDILPPPTLPELYGDSAVHMLDIQNNLKNLIEYSTMLREKLVNTQSRLCALTTKHPLPHQEAKSDTDR